MALEAVIFRELREAARRKRTFWVRFLYGTALALPLMISYPFIAGSPQNAGGWLFSFFVYWQFALVLLLAPASAVSSVSDERDSGTLGLLLLTRLTPASIMAGKLAVLFGSLVLLLVSGLPMLFFATMLGGVSASQILQAFLVTAWTGLVVAAFGLAVSCYIERTYKASVVAYLTLFFALFVPFILELWAFTVGGGVRPTLFQPLLLLSDVLAGTAGWMQILGFVGLTSAGTALLLLVARRGIARYVHQDEPRGARSRTFARTPAVRRRGQLHDNPVAWREARKATRFPLRPVFLFIFGVLVLSLSFLWEGFGLLWPMLSGLFWMVIYIAVLLRASLLFTEEKERGSLQLLLATPLTDREVIDGKLTVLVREFGLYAGILCVLGVFGAFCFPSSLGGDAGAPFYSAISSLAFFIWTAAVALWSSLVSATATRAVVLTIACFFGYHLVMSIPIALLMLFGRGAAVFCVWSILHLVIAWLVYRWMVRNLRAYCARA